MTNLWWMPTDGSGQIERLATSDNAQRYPSISPDQKYVAFSHQQPQEYDIWIQNIESNEAQPFLDSPYSEHNPQFSPDGRLLAYQSNEQGNWEVFVTPFPSKEWTERISTDGGLAPAWSPDGKELYYRVTLVPESSDGWLLRLLLNRDSRPANPKCYLKDSIQHPVGGNTISTLMDNDFC